jgi:hypothetical protein
MTRHSHRATLELLERRTLLATCHVTSLGDSGAGADTGGGHSRGDLRYCINKLNAVPRAGVIDFEVTGTINLTSALPYLASDIDIQGPGADLLTVRRGSASYMRIFHVGDADVQITGLTVAHGVVSGTPAQGAGIYNTGRLTLRSIVVAANHASGHGHALGGGIFNAGTLTIIDSTISDNRATAATASGFGGGIYNSGAATIIDSSIHSNVAWAERGFGGGVYNLGNLSIDGVNIAGNMAQGDYGEGYGGGILNHRTLVIVNSTIHGNRGHYYGGGIYTEGQYASATISHSTITDNDGPGIWADDLLHLRNTIVAGNIADLDGKLTSSGYNLIADPRRGSGFDRDTDLLGVDPLLGPLADNGGPTQTHALLAGSPAIDAGDPNPVDPPEWDQRGPGFPRIVNGRIDIGAFEVQATGMPDANGARRGSPDPAVALTGGLHLPSARRGSPDPAVATTGGLHLVAWSGDHATTIVSEAPKGRYMTAQGNALGHDPVSDLALKGRNNLAPDAIVMPQGCEDSSPLPRALPWADILRPVGANDDLSPFLDGGIV